MPRLYVYCFLTFLIGTVVVSCNHPINDLPNVILIMADDQGWGDLSMNGNPVVQTPNIDRLGKEGAILENFYVNSVCSPTRAEILTGRYHVRGGVYSTSQGGERLDLDENTIAESFREADYSTGAFGKWHNGMQYPYHPNARGFDEFYGYCSGHWGSYFDAILEHNGEIVQSKGYLTDVLTSKTIDFISSNANKPFFAYLPLNTPHSPMQVPDRWFNKFKDIAFPKHRYSEQENQDKTRAAYAMAENIDYNVGRIINTLEDLDQLENTIIIYLSDNGPNGYRWNNNMKGQKGHTDEGGVRSPFVIKWGDKIKGNQKFNNIAHAIDLYPTLVDLANIPDGSKDNFDGVSLADLLLNKSNISTDRILYSYWSGKLSLRNQQYRLDNENQLFDMTNDRAQMDDVSDQNSDVHQLLVKAKKQWEEEVLSELPEEDSRPFTIAHPDAHITHLPARDANVTGNIKRSNRWPNCSFYTNWANISDSIFWDLKTLSNGSYQPVIYYSCAALDIGHSIHLSNQDGVLSSIEISEAFDPPLRGMEHDRIPRGESYVKDWNTIEMPIIILDTLSNRLSLTLSNLDEKSGIDFRLMTLEKVE